jgi:hypothetical protein
MIDRLKAFLKKPTATLILCGYSFRDEHINEVILQGLENTQTTIAFALFFEVIENFPQAISVARKCSNLNILARDGAVICGQRFNWLEKDAELVSEDKSKWVNWIPVNPANADGKRRAEFTLGDFVVFGEFIQELVGSVRQRPEGANAQ